MKKQIVFIMVDSQSTDMLGCYNNPDIKTPYLDALSKESLTFDQAYTCQPVCGPARSAIFTGLYPHSNGAWTNCVSLYDNVKTIGQRLCDNRIQTAYIGKWHLDGGDYFGNGICPDGWDKEYWYDMRCYLEELTPEERVKSRDGGLSKTGEVTEQFTFAHRCSDRAISYMKQHADDDFLPSPIEKVLRGKAPFFETYLNKSLLSSFSKKIPTASFLALTSFVKFSSP